MTPSRVRMWNGMFAVFAVGIALVAGCSTVSSRQALGAREVQPSPTAGDVHNQIPSIVDDAMAGKVPTITVEEAREQLPGVRLPQSELVGRPLFAMGNGTDSPRRVEEVAVYYDSGIAVVAVRTPSDIDDLKKLADAGAPFVDGRTHVEMRSTQVGRVLTIQGGWQEHAPRVTPSRAIFNIDGVDYTLQSWTDDPLPVEKLVTAAQTMR